MKLVCPVQSTSFSFDQALSNKLHSSLVIRPPASKKIPNASVPSKLHITADSNQSIPTATPLSIKSQIVLLLSNSEPDSANCTIPFNDPIIVQGMRNKKCILANCQNKFGKNTDLIVTTKKVRSPMIFLSIVLKQGQAITNGIALAICICIMSSIRSSRNAVSVSLERIFINYGWLIKIT
jgi:hypothetical protein